MKRRAFVRKLSLCAATLPVMVEAKPERGLTLPPPNGEDDGSPWIYAPTPDHCPPDDDVVWTSDGAVVRMGCWTWKAGEHEGVWRATNGRAVMVTHWCFTDEIEDAPAVPVDEQTLKLADLCERAPLGLEESEAVRWFVHRGVPEFHAKMLVLSRL